TDVARRVNILHYGAEKERNEDEIVEKLIGVMKAIRESKADVRESLEAISREILSEARSCEPLHFVHRAPNDLYGFTACNGINTARILARVVRHEPKLRNRPVDVISSGLIHDIGLLEIKGDFLARTGPLTDRERRELERHPRTGAEMIKRIYVDHPDVIAAVLMHHERLDGTGYPEGTQGNQIETMARLLAVCSTYSGLCCDRPHRPSRPPRTALADTLLMAEQGLLDPLQAEHLLSLSFYPVGSLVELAQGEIAMVVAVGGSGKAGGNPSRPVVAVLTDRRGNPLPKPHHLDLGEAEDYSIARILTTRESKDHLSNDLPQWAA
ncbi:MAG: HD-GYP domain-containing protein, partial [Gemmataceae bacterium]